MHSVRCEKCELHKEAHSNCISTSVFYTTSATGRVEDSPSVDVLIIGEAPGKQEDERGENFVGRTGELLRSMLNELGINAHLANVCRCRPPSNRKPRTKEIEACFPYLEEDIARLKPKYIMLLEATAIQAITGKRSVSVSGHRGWKNWTYKGAHLIATYPPAAALRDPEKIKDIVDDFLRISSHEFLEPETVQVTHVDKVSDLPPLLAFDLETTGLDPFDPNGEILCVAWSYEKNKAYVSTNIAGFIEVLNQDTTRTVIGHNTKFDIHWLMTRGLQLRNLVLVDTRVMAHLVDENLPSKSLKSLAKIETGYGDWDKEIEPMLKGGQSIYIDSTKLQVYCGFDAAATWRLYQVYIKTIGCTLLHGEQKELLKLLAEMEYQGIQVDEELLDTLDLAFKVRIRRLEKELTEQLGGSNPASHKQLCHALIETRGWPIMVTTPKGAPSFSEKALEALSKSGRLPEKERQLADDILYYRGLCKLRSTYLNGMKKRLDKFGVVHPSFDQAGTTTGRFASSKPNFQNIPDGRGVKKIFIPRKNKVFIQADYSQIELRLCAFLSRDQAMLQSLRSGEDIHTATAQSILGKKEVSKEERRFAKTINFGILYGMGPKRLHEEAGIKLKDAKKFIDTWFTCYPQVKQYFVGVEKDLLSTGEVTSIFGRKRRLPPVIGDMDRKDYMHMLRQACNFPIQSTASEITQMAMIYVQRYLPEVRVVCNVHDSILFEVPATKVGPLSKKIKELMEDTTAICQEFGFRVDIDVPTLVEMTTGRNWEDQHEL